MLEQVVENAKLAVRQMCGYRTEASLAPRKVEHERSGTHDVAVFTLSRPAQLHVDARDELIEGERLAQVVGCAEPEAAQLRRQIRPSRNDHDRQLRARTVQRTQHAQPVEPGQEQIEQHEVVRVALRTLEALAAIASAVDCETLGLQPSREEAEDSRLILDHQNPHRRTTITDLEMT